MFFLILSFQFLSQLLTFSVVRHWTIPATLADVYHLAYSALHFHLSYYHQHLKSRPAAMDAADAFHLPVVHPMESVPMAVHIPVEAKTNNKYDLTFRHPRFEPISHALAFTKQNLRENFVQVPMNMVACPPLLDFVAAVRVAAGSGLGPHLADRRHRTSVETFETSRNITQLARQISYLL